MRSNLHEFCICDANLEKAIILDLVVPSTLDDNIEDNKNNEVIPNEISNDIDFTKATRNADGKLCVLKEEMVKSVIKGLFHK